MSSESTFTMGQYLELLDLTYQVVDSLKGKRSSDIRWPDCQQLATKLFFHTSTIYWLMQGTRAPVPRSGRGAFFFDFASIAVLTRAVLETYLTMFEVFFEQKSEDDFEFNHALWLLSGFVLRENIVPTDPKLRGAYVNAQKEISELRNRIQETKRFSRLKPSEQRKVLSGQRKRDWPSLAKESGFSERMIRHIYSYFSSYVHADGLSSTQIVSATTRQDQMTMMKSQMSVVMITMSKLIIAYADRFPEAKTACDMNAGAFHLAQVLSGAANRIQFPEYD